MHKIFASEHASDGLFNKTQDNTTFRNALNKQCKNTLRNSFTADQNKQVNICSTVDFIENYTVE